MHFYTDISAKTYQQFGPGITKFAWLLISIHVTYCLVNLYVTPNISEPILWRAIAVLPTVPFAFSKHLERHLPKSFLANLLPISFTLIAPGFMVGAWMLELSNDEPDQITLIRMQYEIAATMVLVYLAIPSVLFVTAVSAAIVISIFSIFLVFVDPKFEMLNTTWVTFLSGYFLAALAAILMIRLSAETITSKTAALSALGSSVAHELRTPLLSISTAVQALSKKKAMDNAPHQYLEGTVVTSITHDSEIEAKALRLIEDEARSASTLIDIFLLNISGGSEAIRRETTEVFTASAAIFEATTRYPYRSNKERGAIELDLNQDFSIQGSQLLLVHVLFNLMKNTFEQLAGTEDPLLRISLDRIGKLGRISVFDNGIGIPNKTLTRLFEPFYTQGTNQGTGIGLNFCKNIVESTFGGKISCKSTVDVSTQFDLTFPTSSDPPKHTHPPTRRI